MYLTQGLHRSLQRHPDKLALSHLGAGAAAPLRAHSFRQLVDAAGRQAAALVRHGVRAGDRVAMLAPNDDRLVLAVFACWWIGAVACPLNVRWSRVELHDALLDAEPALLLVDESLQAQTLSKEPPAPGVSTIGLDPFAAQAAELAPVPDSRTGGDALATLLYTGGTTGRSKGVMLTHTNFWASCMSRGAELNNAPDAVSLLVAPLFHVAGLSRMVGQTLVGGTCITMAQFRPDAVIAAIESQRITDTVMVPTMLHALLDEPGFTPQRVASLNRIAFGAAPMSPALLDRALAAWPQAEFFQAYGLTETAGAVCINLPENHRSAQARAAGKLNAVGRAGLGAEIIVADLEGRELPRGEVGEVLCRGAMVTAGYWRRPEVTAAAFVDGWFRTGDAGRMTEDGTLTIVDRLKDMIISGGENVYSAEVETALQAHALVAQAAVVGVPDDRWGEAVHACIVPKPGAADAQALQEALQAWCRERLAGYKCPRGYTVLEALPLSAAGKVLKNELRRNARKPAA